MSRAGVCMMFWVGNVGGSLNIDPKVAMVVGGGGGGGILHPAAR